MVRVCKKCKVEKGLDCFSKSKTSKLGLNTICKECKNSYADRYRQSNRAKVLIGIKSSRLKKLPEYIRKNREYYQANKHIWKTAEGEWLSKFWKRQNRAYCTANTQEYRSKKQRAMPSWADARAILKFYQACPKGFEVDHILPLRGRTISGLHVLENLQYLPAQENRQKSNKVIL